MRLSLCLISLHWGIKDAFALAGGGPDGRVSINQNWLFGGEYSKGSEYPRFDDSGFQGVTIPHVVTPLGWDNYDNNTWNKQWVYRHHFDLSHGHESGAKRVFLDFDGVLTIAKPRINGHALKAHEGGYLPFSYEVTDYVRESDNLLSVIVDARWSYVPPDGSDVGPVSVDYLEPGGINRDVALRIVPTAFIADVFAKPTHVLKHERYVAVECTIDSTRPMGRVEVVSELLDGKRRLARTKESLKIPKPGNITINLNISAPHVDLWSPESPKLYKVVTKLVVDGESLHSFSRNIGFREATFKTEGFFLNGKRLQIFGLNRHQTFPYVGMSASERLQKRDADLLKELNCNMVRCSHYPQSPYFLDRCDELGIMVWQEVPGWQFIGNETWQESVLKDVHDMVVRDRSRPSVIIWGTQVNESPREPDLYTKTKELARKLDDSRQASGSETSQSLDGWVADVFSYDDYHSTDGNAELLPPLTNVPYLISEAVGALDGPRFYRWIDTQHVQQDQAKLHAQAHNMAGSNPHYAGLIAWAGINYDSLNGNIYKNVKTPGVMDSFRVYKPGAAFYLSQKDPSSGVVLEPAFYWDFGATSPVTILGKNATIWSNCDTVKVHIDGKHTQTLEPDKNGFPNTAYPPFYLDTTNIDRAKNPELRLDGYISGRKAISREFSSNTKADRLHISGSDKRLFADGIDSTLLTFRAVDEYGNPRPYASGDVDVSVTGPGQWVNQLVSLDVQASPLVIDGSHPSSVAAELKAGVFSFTDSGGVGGVLIRTIAGHSGTIRVDISHPALGRDSVQIKSVPKPGHDWVSSGPRSSPQVSNVTLILNSTDDWSVEQDNDGSSWLIRPRRAGTFVAQPTITALYDLDGQPAKTIKSVPVYAPLSIGQARNSHGISNDSNTLGADLDGLGNSYSAQALASAGLKPGGDFNASGITFTWPNVPSDQPDNILSLGQTVFVSGNGQRLGFVGASVGSYGGGVGAVFYSDGTTSSFTLELGNFVDEGFLTNAVVATTSYINSKEGRNEDQKGTVFSASVPVTRGKRVVAVRLPESASPPSPNLTRALHIFCIAIG